MCTIRRVNDLQSGGRRPARNAGPGGRSPAREPVLHALTGICGPDFARHAGAADTVAGRQARFVAVPGTVDAVAAVLRLAADRGLVVVPRGAGTKLDRGTAPARVDLLLDTGRLAGVRHHPSGAPVAEIGAGTPVRAVQAVLARRGQRLAADPPSPGATLGGVLAVDEAGPLRHRYGTPRQHLVEIHHVDVAGGPATVAVAAGPGGPTPRGLCGPADRLAVVVSASVRVQPVPASRLWVSRSVWTPLEVHDLVRDVLSTALTPAAVEVDLPGAPVGGWTPRGRHPAGTRGPGTLTVLLEGGPAAVAEGATRLVAVLGGDTSADATPPAWWGRYPFDTEQVALHVTVPVADLHAAVYALRDAAGTAVPVRGSAGAGVVHAALPAGTPPARVTAILDAVQGVLLARGGRCAVLAAPDAVRAGLDPDRFADH